MNKSEFILKAQCFSEPEKFQANKHLLKKVNPLYYEYYIVGLQIGCYFENLETYSNCCWELEQGTALCIDNFVPILMIQPNNKEYLIQITSFIAGHITSSNGFFNEKKFLEEYNSSNLKN